MLSSTFVLDARTAGIPDCCRWGFIDVHARTRMVHGHRVGRPQLRRPQRDMNTAGQVGGILSPIVLAYIVDTIGDWNMPLQIWRDLFHGRGVLGLYSPRPCRRPPGGLSNVTFMSADVLRWRDVIWEYHNSGRQRSPGT
jgi:hypothetical protein